jgi:hypothetical protein
MSDVAPAAANVTAAAEAAADAGSYGLLVAQLDEVQAAVIDLAETAKQLGDDVRETAGAVNRLAENAARLKVDSDTIGEHHEAAALIGACADHADTFSSSCMDLSALLAKTANDHRADYGPVTEAVQAMPVPMADRTFYASH